MAITRDEMGLGLYREVHEPDPPAQSTLAGFQEVRAATAHPGIKRSLDEEIDAALAARDATRPTQSVPEMRQWVNEQVGQQCIDQAQVSAERAARGQFSPEFVRVFNGDKSEVFKVDAHLRTDQVPYRQVAEQQIAAKPPAEFASGFTDHPGFLAPPAPPPRDEERKSNAESFRKLAEMMKVKPSGCPNCGYPDTKDGKHFKGIYRTGAPCDHCGASIRVEGEDVFQVDDQRSRDRSCPPVERRPLLAAFADGYVTARTLADQDMVRQSNLPPQALMTAKEVVDTRLYYTPAYMAPTGHHVGDLLTIWRLLATIDSLMAEKETV